MSLVVEHAARPVGDVLASSRVLAVLGFETADACEHSADPRHVATGLRSLGDSPTCEVWRCREPVSWGWEGPVCWASSDQVLFMAVTLEADDKLADLACAGWRRLLRFAVDRGCPHILRAWNHVPRINDGQGDTERYKQFCAGRARAFDAQGYSRDRYPAASAVGNDGDMLVVYALASADAGRHHENPRQISAYSYPREYGPRPPSFARATSKIWPDAMHVYISGTASIVGHRSRCPGDVEGQLAVTLANMDRLLGQMDGTGSGVPDLLRVYVRDPADLAAITAGVDRYAPDASVTYVRADICRAELALEIEGVMQRPRPGSP